MKTTFANPGETIYSSIKRVQSELNYNSEVTLVFNEIEINVHKDSRIDDLSRIYYLKHQLNQNI